MGPRHPRPVGSRCADDVALCAYLPDMEEPVAIDDTLRHDAMRSNPLVTGAPFVRSFLSHPIRGDDGMILGTIAAAGTAPRGFNDAHLASVAQAARLVGELLTLRKAMGAMSTSPVLVDRRRFENMLQAELSGGGDRPIVGLAKIDNFHEISSRYGSDSATAILDWIMECATEMSPPEGRLSRIGDRTFGFTLPDMSAAAAGKLVRALQELVGDVVTEVTGDEQSTGSLSCVLSQPEANEPVNACWDRMMMGLDQAEETGTGCFVDLTGDASAVVSPGMPLSQTG